MRRSRITLSIAVGALMAGSVVVGGPAAAAPGDIDVQLLALSDFHGRFAPQAGGDGTLPSPSGPLTVGGAAYMSTLLDARAADFAATSDNGDESFFVGAGDLISASPFESSVFKDEPTIEVLNALGLDYSSVGNHEFDRGFAELQRIVDGGCVGVPNVDSCFTDSTGDSTFDGADWPYLGANVVDSVTGEPVLPPYSIVESNGVSVGLIGIVTSDTPTLVTPTGIAGLTFQDEAVAINREAAVLQAAGVEAIAVLIHEGGVQSGTTGFYNTCVGLTGPIVDINAGTTAAVDLIISAHTHTPYDCELPDPSGALRPVTQAGFYGKAITDIRMEINPTTGEVDRTTITADNIPVTRDVAADPEVQSIVDYWLAESADARLEVVGTQTADLDRAYRTGSPVRDSESGLGNLIADAQLDALQDDPTFGNPVAAFMNPGGIRADINCAAGPGEVANGSVTFGEVFTAQPFGNTVNSVSITGAAIDLTLEQQWIDSAGAERTMLQLSVSDSLRYDFDARLPLGERVSNIRIDGVVIDPAANYVVAANSFLTAGGDGFTALVPVGAPPVTGPVDSDALADYIGENSPVSPPLLDRANSLDPNNPLNDDGTGTGPCVVAVFDPAISIAPDPVRRGGTVTVSGTGFTPGDEAVVDVPDRWTAPAPQIVLPDGTVTFVVDVPTDARLGRNTIFVDTVSGSASDTVVVQRFNPRAAASRNVVAPGQSFTLTGFGFIPGQEATAVLPAGWVAPPPATVGADGTVVFSLTVPVDAPNGRVTLTISTEAGSASDNVRVRSRGGPAPTGPI